MQQRKDRTRRKHRHAQAVIAAAAVALLAGCSVGPDYQRPEAPLPASFHAGSTATVKVPSRWWQGFGSAELNALEDSALANNQDLKAAVSRIVETASQGDVAQSALLPLIQGVGLTERRAPKGGGVNSTVPGTGTQIGGSDSSYQVGLQASYEVDLWGKNRMTAASAIAAARASIFDREVVAMTLTADVATAYFQYLSLNDRIVIARHNVDNMKEVLVTVGKRITAGEGSELERAQQRSVLAQAESVEPVLELQKEQAFNRLAILLGRTPESLTLTGRTMAGLSAPVVAPGLPSDLLWRRPDIQRAEAQLIAANADIGTARAKLLPTFGLTGQIGLGSTILKILLSPAGFLYSASANLSQTLFDDGKTASEIAYSEAHFRELVQAYRKAILAALQDVDNALAEVHWTGLQEEAQARSVRYARASYGLSSRAFTVGTTDYLSVLESDRTRYAEEDKNAQARLVRLTASVDLFKALGGGFELIEKTSGAKP